MYGFSKQAELFDFEDLKQRYFLKGSLVSWALHQTRGHRSRSQNFPNR